MNTIKKSGQENHARQQLNQNNVTILLFLQVARVHWNIFWELEPKRNVVNYPKALTHTASKTHSCKKPACKDQKAHHDVRTETT